MMFLQQIKQLLLQKLNQRLKMHELYEQSIYEALILVMILKHHLKIQSHSKKLLQLKRLLE
jgi:hypothetical protein